MPKSAIFKHHNEGKGPLFLDLFVSKVFRIRDAAVCKCRSVLECRRPVGPPLQDGDGFRRSGASPEVRMFCFVDPVVLALYQLHLFCRLGSVTQCLPQSFFGR